jgi:Spx/MgsR family transcriptional regulator
MHKKSKTAAAAKTVAKKAKPALRFLHKPNCTSCRKARGLLEKRGVELDLRDLGKDRLTTEELDQLIGDRDYRKFLNTRNEVYRQRKMAQNPPTRSEALRLMATEPNLIRRPVVICGDQIVLGFDAEALSKIAG